MDLSYHPVYTMNKIQARRHLVQTYQQTGSLARTAQLVSFAFLKIKGFAISTALSFKPTRFSLVLWGAFGVVPVGMLGGLLLWPLVEALPWLISKELEFLVRLSRFSDLPWGEQSLVYCRSEPVASRISPDEP